MDFPRLVFRSPGKNDCQGGTYDHVTVENEDEYKAALAAGYAASIPEALKKPLKAGAPKTEPPKTSGAPASDKPKFSTGGA